jgi:hypothetical protein
VSGAVVRIDCGSSEDPAGKGGEAWGRDRLYTALTTEAPLEPSFVAGKDAVVYGSVRRFVSGSGYRLAAPLGRYRVTLHFGGRYVAPPAAFHVSIEGQRVLEGYECPHGPGKAERKLPDRKTFEVSVDDGVLDIEFEEIEGRGRPEIAALEVERLAPR